MATNMFCKKIGKALLTVAVVGSMFIGVIFAMDLNHPSLKGSFNALGTGYAIARWPYTDGDVPEGTSVQVRAATTNPDATHVIFVWKANDVEVYRSGIILLSSSGDTWEGETVYDAYNSRLLNVAGSWGVQAYFYDDPAAPYSDALAQDKISIRAISFHPFVIPEVPYGVVGSMTAMFVAFIAYQKRF